MSEEKKKRHVWSFGVDEDVCGNCGIRRRKRNVIMDKLNITYGIQITEYFVSGKWDDANNQENRWCKKENNEMGIRKSTLGNVVEKYDLIPALPAATGGFFQHIPGVYCKNCGETFALYSYSVHQPDTDARDENGKPYYNECFKCKKH